MSTKLLIFAIFVVCEAFSLHASSTVFIYLNSDRKGPTYFISSVNTTLSFTSFTYSCTSSNSLLDISQNSLCTVNNTKLVQINAISTPLFKVSGTLSLRMLELEHTPSLVLCKPLLDSNSFDTVISLSGCFFSSILSSANLLLENSNYNSLFLGNSRIDNVTRISSPSFHGGVQSLTAHSSSFSQVTDPLSDGILPGFQHCNNYLVSNCSIKLSSRNALEPQTSDTITYRSIVTSTVATFTNTKFTASATASSNIYPTTESSGGALFAMNLPNLNLTIDGCFFSKCTAADNAGCIYANNIGSFVAKNSSFCYSTAKLGLGGALLMWSITRGASISSCTFRSTFSHARGGAVAFDLLSGSSSIENCFFVHCSATLPVSQESTNIREVTARRGGALDIANANTASTIRISNTLFRSCTAPGGGGAARLFLAGLRDSFTLTLPIFKDCYFDKNSGGTCGDDIYVIDSAGLNSQRLVTLFSSCSTTNLDKSVYVRAITSPTGSFKTDFYASALNNNTRTVDAETQRKEREEDQLHNDTINSIKKDEEAALKKEREEQEKKEEDDKKKEEEEEQRRKEEEEERKRQEEEEKKRQEEEERKRQEEEERKRKEEEEAERKRQEEEEKKRQEEEEKQRQEEEEAERKRQEEEEKKRQEEEERKRQEEEERKRQEEEEKKREEEESKKTETESDPDKELTEKEKKEEEERKEREERERAAEEERIRDQEEKRRKATEALHAKQLKIGLIIFASIVLGGFVITSVPVVILFLRRRRLPPGATDGRFGRPADDEKKLLSGDEEDMHLIGDEGTSLMPLDNDTDLVSSPPNPQIPSTTSPSSTSASVLDPLPALVPAPDSAAHADPGLHIIPQQPIQTNSELMQNSSDPSSAAFEI